MRNIQEWTEDSSIVDVIKQTKTNTKKKKTTHTHSILACHNFFDFAAFTFLSNTKIQVSGFQTVTVNRSYLARR